MLTHTGYAWVLVLLSQVAPLRAQVEATRLTRGSASRAFLKQLDRPKVPLDLKVERPEQSQNGLITERLSIATEKRSDGQIERVPVLVVRPQAVEGSIPAVIVLHGTGGDKDKMKSWLVELAERGIMGWPLMRVTTAIGQGGRGLETYNKAIIRAWRAKPGEVQEHPFYYDTCWDLWRTLDYLESRADVDSKRLGMLGISMGGIQTWLAASVDERVAVAVPAVAVQSFRWSLENEQWQGRAKSIGVAHQAAAQDLGESAVNARVCRDLWNKLIPGILTTFDGPSMLRLFAGRPLLILNGDRDPNCPITGALDLHSPRLSKPIKRPALWTT